MRLCLAASSLVVALVLAGPSVSASGPFAEPQLTQVAGDDHVALTVTLTPVEGAAYPTGAVPFTAEPYSVVVPPSAQTTEFDIFGSGLAMDLDGDGQSSGTISVGCFAGGVVSLGGTPGRPFVEGPLAGAWRGNYRNLDGTPRVARVGDKGAWFAVYTPCAPEQSTSLALSRASARMVVHEVPGPVLQLMVFEEVFLPSKDPTVVLRRLRLDGRKKPRGTFEATTHAFEPLFGSKPVWHGVVWRMIPLGKRSGERTVTVRVSDPAGVTRRRMVVAIVNTSPSPGVRVRAAFAHAPLTL